MKHEILTLWYFGNISGIVREWFGIPSSRAFWQKDTYVFNSLWHNATFCGNLLSLRHHAIVIVGGVCFFVRVQNISNCTVEFYPPTEPRRAQSFFLNTLICLEFSEVACAPLRARSKLAERKVIYALFRMALCVLLGASATFVDSSENKRKSKALCSPWLRGGLKTTSSFCFSLL